MKSFDDITDDLRRWGLWQRTNVRSNLSYITVNFSPDLGEVIKETPCYIDEQSQNLDLIMAKNLEKIYIKILALSFVEHKSNVEAAFSLGLCVTSYKLKRREAMSMLIGLLVNNRIDKASG